MEPVITPPQTSQTPPPPQPAVVPTQRKIWPNWLGVAAAVIALIGTAATVSYSLGFDKGKASVAVATEPTPTPLQVPQGATIISQCAVGRGTQYVKAENIPHGPVFNVYQGKVIGLEYMVGKDDLTSNKNFLSLPLYGGTYDHLDIGLLSQGHSGYPEPHYHVDLYNISPAESAAITCK